MLPVVLQVNMVWHIDWFHSSGFGDLSLTLGLYIASV